MSVVTSMRRPLEGAGLERVKVRDCCSPGLRVREAGETDTFVPSIRNVPIGELPAGPLTITW
jgi:hypothetical protein